LTRKKQGARWVLAWLLASAPGGTGCERITQARQCQELASTVNEAMERIREVSESKPTPEELHEASRAYANLAQHLGPLEFAEKQLAIDVAELNRILERAASATLELARARAGDERAQASLLERELQAMSLQMQAQGTKLDRACAKP
jgi:hypothetical protein